ncbi:hypothetical protein ACFFGT_13240 [Mucilaginibacter angelicae]|uniref:Glycyl-tRNA synthetase subunit alpha n=1 Tax=Mucilaginibacter angelicae TaxID=869718 RepID=A0ABV6L6U5_9SPHI
MKFWFIMAIAILMSISSHAQTALHLYGGKDHDKYLGCLNCNTYDKNSIWNDYGSFGSSYSSSSIWNEYGTYGGEYSPYSPFNNYAQYPPVIVDKDGNFYGYLTVNTYHDKRAESQIALIIYKYWNLIEKNVSDWYAKIFN